MDSWNGPELETTPLAWGSTGFCDKELRETGEQLRVSPNANDRMFWGAFLLVGGGAAMIILTIFVFFGEHIKDGVPQGAHWAGAVLVLPFVIIGGYGLLSRRPIVFQRSLGRLTFGPAWSRKQRPLEDVAAVQLIKGNYVSGDGRGYQPYELNLVFRDLSRWNVSNHPDLVWTRDASLRIAEFLNVPLVDCV